jgi:hypothetical protein
LDWSGPLPAEGPELDPLSGGGPQASLPGYPQYYNKWYAWTTAENRRQGWVNAVAASGGANDGKFSNTPSCHGAHGSPF